MKKKDHEMTFYLSFLAIVLVTLYFIERYRYQDCKRVGHETLYCILNMGK